ncbi:hypothetical protein NPX13_g8240 [Xylaria arbuscula]|uniref:Bacteriophage T5 Orf172 DNA-binding domain-containing protein n=1 Tax=Xylaria arbuscula TaxID=114810 RepID=A0A9W8TII6_9PEZI|nr:hypothetical protein NPX13_g8240 [Xylaria arbuscula]
MPSIFAENDLSGVVVGIEKMKLDLVELLESPSVASSCTFQATPVTPTPKQLPSLETPVVSKSGRRRSTERNRPRPSRSNKLDPLHSHLGSTDEGNNCEQFHQSPPKISITSPSRENTNIRRRSSSPKSSPSTPQRTPPPLPSILASAPGRLQSSHRTNRPRSSSHVDNKSWSRRDVDDEIKNTLIEPLTEAVQKSRTKLKIGDVYIFKATPQTEPHCKLLKIGSTAKSEKSRKDAIMNVCRFSSLKQHPDPRSMWLHLFEKAEKLAHGHLVDRKRKFVCPCGKSHQEYFDVDTKTAERVVQCWRQFCASDPYDAKGELRPFWKHRLGNLGNLRYWGSQEVEGLDELESRHRKWEEFANPRWLDKFRFDATVKVGKAWAKRLHIITVINLFIIAFFASPSLKLFCLWLMIVGSCMYWE